MTPDPDCLFCKILAGTIPADTVYQDEECIAFRDINPKAPIHILVIPRAHVDRLSSTTAADAGLLGHLLMTAGRIADQEGIAESGYRVVVNNGRDGGQEVEHLHLHVLGGRSLTWPPG